MLNRKSEAVLVNRQNRAKQVWNFGAAAVILYLVCSKPVSYFFNHHFLSFINFLRFPNGFSWDSQNLAVGTGATSFRQLNISSTIKRGPSFP
jgi:hypothetical protein